MPFYEYSQYYVCHTIGTGEVRSSNDHTKIVRSTKNNNHLKCQRLSEERQLPSGSCSFLFRNLHLFPMKIHRGSLKI